MESKQLEVKFIPLTFITESDKLKELIKNTIIFQFILKKYNNLTKLGNLLSNTRYGFTASAQENGNYKLIRITDIQHGRINWNNVPFCDCTNPEDYLLKKGDILVARTGGTVGKTFFFSEDAKNAVFASYLIRLRTDEKRLLPKYAFYFLNSYSYWSQITNLKSGSAQPNVNAEKLKEILIPYCDLAVQHKIVYLIETGKTDDKNLDEINKLLDNTTKSFHLIEEFNHNNLRLPSIIDNLRHKILKDAIQGNLVQQNLNDESAFDLIKRITAENERIIGSGKIKKSKSSFSIKEEEKIARLPKGWAWSKLTDLIDYSRKYPLKRGPFGSSIRKSMFIKKCDDAFKVYEQKNAIYNDANIGEYYISKQDFEKLKSFEVEGGDLIISCSGTIGKIGFLPNNIPKGIINQALLKVCINENIILKKYFGMLFEGYIMKTDELTDLKATAMKNIPGMNILKTMPLPLPPLAEQRRIVEMFDKLISYCDELEKKVNENRNNSEKLLYAVLKESFEK